MNKSEANKCVGERVSLHPPARRAGVVIDSDWLVVAVNDDSLSLEHVETRQRVLVGFDGIRSYFSEPNRTTPTQKFGSLQLLVQLDITVDGKARTTPLPLLALTAPDVDVLETETGGFATRDYRSLWPAARAAVRHLVVAGDATERQVASAISSSFGLEENLLARIAMMTKLIQPVHSQDTRESRLFGYKGPYMVNPVFRPALARLVADDPDLKNR